MKNCILSERTLRTSEYKNKKIDLIITNHNLAASTLLQLYKSPICQHDVFGKMFLASIHFVLALTPSCPAKYLMCKYFSCINETQQCLQIPFKEKAYILVERKKESRLRRIN